MWEGEIEAEKRKSSEMKCPFCNHPKPHKHDRTSKGSQRLKCPSGKRTFTETLDTLYYRRQVSAEQIETIFQSPEEGTSLRGLSRVSKRADGTVVSIVRATSQKAQKIHNEAVCAVECEEIVADEMWSFIKKKALWPSRTNGWRVLDWPEFSQGEWDAPLPTNCFRRSHA